jgi:putative transposase
VLTTPPILIFPDYKKPFHIFVDASTIGMGAALMQKEDEIQTDLHAKPIAYISRTLNSNEKNWPSVKLECAAIVWALRSFNLYIHGLKTIVHTDHQPATYFVDAEHPNKKLPPMLSRWLVELLQYGDNVSLKYVKGKENRIADALSRIEREGEFPELEDKAEFPLTYLCQAGKKIIAERQGEIRLMNRWEGKTPNPWMEKPTEMDRQLEPTMRMNQRDDPILSAVIDVIEKGTPYPEVDEDVEDAILWYISNCEIRKGILMQISKMPGGHEVERIILPPKSRYEAFQAFHESPIGGGHMSLKKVIAKSWRYTWYGKARDMRLWHLSCHRCQEVRPSKQKCPIRPFVYTHLLQRMGVDLCGPIPETKDGNKYIMNFIDVFSKYIISVAVPDTKASTFVKAFISEVVLVYGTPEELISDNATNFSARIVQEITDLLRVKKIFCTPYHSEGNGLVERSFRTWRSIIAKLTENQGADFDRLLPYVAFSYNTSVHEMTEETPFYLMMGRDPRFPFDVATYRDPSDVEAMPDVHDEKRKMWERIKISHELVREFSEKAIRRMAEQQHKKAKPRGIQRGDLVMFKNVQKHAGEYGKFRPAWRGTYRVDEIAPDNLHCHVTPYGRIMPNNPIGENGRMVHMNQIKLYIEHEPLTEGDELKENIQNNDEAGPSRVAPKKPRPSKCRRRKVRIQDENEPDQIQQDEFDEVPDLRSQQQDVEAEPINLEENNPVVTRSGRRVKFKKYNEFIPH